MVAVQHVLSRLVAVAAASFLLIGLGAVHAESASAAVPIGGHVYLGNSATPATTGQVSVHIYQDPNNWDNRSPILNLGVAADGSWSTALDPGEYQVQFVPAVNGFQPVWNGGAFARGYAPIVVTGAANADIDGVVPTLASLTGHVALGQASENPGAGEVTVQPQHNASDGNGWTSGLSVHADADGNFSLSGLVGGSWRLHFSYTGAGSFQDGFSPSFELTDSEFAVPSFTMSPGALVSGIVTDSAGSPMVGVDVTAMGATFVNPSFVYKTVVTDSTGKYVLSGLPSQRYTIQVYDPALLSPYPAESWHSSVSPSAPPEQIYPLDTDVLPAHDITLYKPGYVYFAPVCGDCGSTTPAVADVNTSLDVFDVVTQKWEDAYRVGPPSADVGFFRGVLPGTYRLHFHSASDDKYTEQSTVSFTVAEGETKSVAPSVEHRRVFAKTVSGVLYRRTADGRGHFVSPTKVASGLSSFSQFSQAGDFDGDGKLDVLGRSSSGSLYLFAGTGTGGLHSRKLVSTAVRASKRVFAAGDLNGDGWPDVLAESTGGTLKLYPGRGDGTLGAPSQVRSTGAWKSYTALIPSNHVNFGQFPGLFGRTSHGDLLYFAGDGNGALASGVKVASGLGSVRDLLSVDDLNGDGYPDLVGRTTSGNLDEFRGETQNRFKSGTKLASGWGSYSSMF